MNRVHKANGIPIVNMRDYYFNYLYIELYVSKIIKNKHLKYKIRRCKQDLT